MCILHFSEESNSHSAIIHVHIAFFTRITSNMNKVQEEEKETHLAQPLVGMVAVAREGCADAGARPTHPLRRQHGAPLLPASRRHLRDLAAAEEGEADVAAHAHPARTVAAPHWR